MTVALPPLPYAKDALAPHVSAQTLDFHYDKHHRAYVTALNRLIDGTPLQTRSLEEITPLQTRSLEEITKSSAKDEAQTQIFHNAAQAWNHDFFWHSMKPGGGGVPSDQLAAQIDRTFRGLDNFRAEFLKAAEAQFGSGWVWLVLDRGRLRIVKTANADTPLVLRQTPLLTCDVWEHAYYLDYQNRRTDFVSAFLDHLVDWEFVAQNLQRHASTKAA